jgi:signal transduction histidine kinase
MDAETRSPWRYWALLTLIATLIALLNFFIGATSWRAEGNTRPLSRPFLWEMTGAYALLMLLPAVLAFMHRFPIDRATFVRRVPLHLLVMVAMGATHTLLMWASRTFLHRLFGWEAYDYGDMRYRFLMEGGKQSIAYWMIYAVVAVVAYARRNRERELRGAHLERELTEARLSALKMQLNPHFLFNTLNMISSHVYDEPRTAEAMIAHLSDFLRSTLRLSRSQEVPLEQELEFLETYLAIMKARFEDRLVVELDVADDARGALVPHLILQPLVENAVTHCMEDHRGQGMIRLATGREGGRLRLVIEDNGPGLPGEAEDALGRGVGLTNTAERLRHLYGPDHLLDLANRREGGLRLVIEIPYHTASAPAP